MITREQQLANNIPELFDSYKSVLYVGASHRRQHFLENFKKKYDKIVVLEVFKLNVEYLKENFADQKTEIIHGNVQNVKDLVSQKFDVCFWWHGPEHVPENVIGPTLSDLESVTEKMVVLGMPFGHYEQGSVYENERICPDL